MKFIFIVLSIVSGIMPIAAMSAETEDIGAAHITLKGGKRGKPVSRRTYYGSGQRGNCA